MHIIDALPAKVDTVVLAVSYMKEALEDHFRKNDCGRKVVLVNENRPLGTGGAIRNVRQHLDGTFLCFNGDIISSLDPSSLLHFHRKMGGIGTLALWQVPDPSTFGVVRLQDQRVVDFQEKPAPGTAFSDLINAGVYAFEPEVLDHIGEGVVSLEREVFPKILDRGLFGYRFGGYWMDCGTPESYLSVQSLLIDHGQDLFRPAQLEGAEVLGPNHLDGVEMVRCRVGPHVCARPRSRIADGSTVERSMLMEGARVGRGCQVRDSILGPGVVVEDGQTVFGKVLVSATSRG